MIGWKSWLPALSKEQQKQLNKSSHCTQTNYYVSKSFSSVESNSNLNVPLLIFLSCAQGSSGLPTSSRSSVPSCCWWEACASLLVACIRAKETSSSGLGSFSWLQVRVLSCACMCRSVCVYCMYEGGSGTYLSFNRFSRFMLCFITVTSEHFLSPLNDFPMEILKKRVTLNVETISVSALEVSVFTSECIQLFCFCALSGLSNIIGVIVYISAALGDISPKKDEDKKWQYSYGWSFYFGGLSFIMAEMVGVLAVNIYIEKNKELRCRSRTDIFKSTTHAMLRLPSYRFRRRSRSSSRSTDPSRSRDPSPVGGGGGKNFGLPPSALLSQGPISVSTLPNPHSRSHTALAGGDISLYTLSRDPKLGGLPPMYGTVDRATLYQLHNCFPKDGGGGGVMMSGTLPSLKSHNPSNSSNSNAQMPNSVGSGPPPFTSSTVDRERGMGTLDRLKGDRESNSNTLNRKTTPV